MHTSCLVLKWQRFVPGKKKNWLENVIFLGRTVIIKVFSFLLPLRNTCSAFSVQNGFCYSFWDYSQLHPSVDTRGFF